MDYKKVDFWGSGLDEAILMLKDYNRKGEKVCTEFNGVMLYSDTVTTDSAYLAVTGKTKKEFDDYLEEQHREYERQEAEHKAKIPTLIPMYIEKGRKLLKEKYWKLWEQCVPIRLDDLYHGWELDCCLDVVKVLQEESDFGKAKEMFEGQGHSGMSAGLTMSMIVFFCDNGKDFAKFMGFKVIDND